MNEETNQNPERPATPPETESVIVGYCRMCGKGLDQAGVNAADGTIYCAEHMPVNVGAQSASGAAPYAGSAPAASAQAAASSSGPSMGAGSFAAGSPSARRNRFEDSPYTDSPYTRPAPPPVPQLAPNHDVSPGLAFVLGMIPGVGAIYNGQYAKGLVHVFILGMLISAADASNDFTPLFALSITGFWFYMAFEAYHTARNRRMGYAVDEFSSLIRPGQSSKFPLAPILLIVIGVVFLLDNLDLLNLQEILRYWPALMILAGAYMLYTRVSPDTSGPSKPPGPSASFESGTSSGVGGSGVTGRGGVSS